MDPLSEPGHTDLTANVDFSYLAEAISDVGTSISSLMLVELTWGSQQHHTVHFRNPTFSTRSDCSLV